MKQAFMRILMIFVVGLILAAFTDKLRAPRLLTVSLPADRWQNILNVIDASTAPHLNVRTAQDDLVPILQSQANIPDSLFDKKDSIKLGHPFKKDSTSALPGGERSIKRRH